MGVRTPTASAHAPRPHSRAEISFNHPIQRQRKYKYANSLLWRDLGCSSCTQKEIQKPLVFGGVLWKSPKRRLWRMKRGGFEEVSRFSRHNVAGNRLTRRCRLFVAVDKKYAAGGIKRKSCWEKWAAGGPPSPKNFPLTDGGKHDTLEVLQAMMGVAARSCGRKCPPEAPLPAEECGSIQIQVEPRTMFSSP